MGDETKGDATEAKVEAFRQELLAEARKGLAGPATMGLLVEIERRWTAAEKRADYNFADLFACTSHVRDLEEQIHRMKERAEEETQAAIEAEARAGRAACDLARLQPLIDAAVAYERAHSIAASAAPVLRAAAGEAVADARDALGHAALEVAEVLRG